MKKILVFVLFFITQNAFGTNILEVFKTMPEHLTPTLNPILKSELMNSYINGSDSVENLYSGKSKIIMFDNDNELLQLQTSAVGKIELKLFTLQNDTIIGFINTVCSELCTSVIKIFNLSWEELPLKDIDYTAFLDNSQTDILLLKSWNMPQFIEYTFTNKNTIKAKFNTFNYLDTGQQKQIEHIVKKSLTLNLQSQESNPKTYVLNIR